MGVDTGPRVCIMGPMENQNQDNVKECPVCGRPYDPHAPATKAATRVTTLAMVQQAAKWRDEQLEKIRRAFELLEDSLGVTIVEEIATDDEPRIETDEEPSEA